MQGARLTAWELQQQGIDTTLICDNMAAQVMKEGRIQLVIIGADRIAANGDSANKIGTYGVALLARAHDIPFYIAAPSQHVRSVPGPRRLIPIEQRDPREVTHGLGRQTAPDGIKVYNPAFDVTPAAADRGHHHGEGDDHAGDGGEYSERYRRMTSLLARGERLNGEWVCAWGSISITRLLAIAPSSIAWPRNVVWCRWTRRYRRIKCVICFGSRVARMTGPNCKAMSTALA